VRHTEFHGGLSIDVGGELSGQAVAIGIRAVMAMVAAIKVASLIWIKRWGKAMMGS
jgi:hypothetical protein